jgi:hypothetical protein
VKFKGLRARLGASLAVGCVLAATGDVEAAAGQKLYVTYQGEVTQFTDTIGAFGAGVGVGSRYVNEYVFDLGLGQRYTTAAYDQVVGGNAFGVASTPLVSSKLTINGQSLSFAGDYTGEHLNWFGQYADSYAQSMQSGVWTLNFNILYFSAPSSLETAFEATGTGWGAFHICDYMQTGPSNGGCVGTNPILTAIVNTDHIAVRLEAGDGTGSVPGGVPEPATWTLAILGFGLAGAALRRSRSLGLA